VNVVHASDPTTDPSTSAANHDALGRRDRDSQAMTEHGIQPIDLLVVNLYPFEQTVALDGVSLEEAIEQQTKMAIDKLGRIWVNVDYGRGDVYFFLLVDIDRNKRPLRFRRLEMTSSGSFASDHYDKWVREHTELREVMPVFFPRPKYQDEHVARGEWVDKSTSLHYSPETGKPIKTVFEGKIKIFSVKHGFLTAIPWDGKPRMMEFKK